MSFSHLTRIRNEMIALEKESEKCVPKESYYVIEIKLPSTVDEIWKWGKNIILNDDHTPLFVYIRNKDLFLFFSRSEEGHHLNGCHQKLCSLYSSNFTQKLCKIGSLSEGEYVTCRLIELSTQNKVFTYLLWKNTETWFQFLSSFTNEPPEKVYQRTIQETLDIMNNNDTWKALSKSQRYGILYKIKEKKGRTVLSSFSKPIDARRKEHYVSYLFT